MHSKNILITAPSLDTSENVSGISTLVKDIIQSSNHQFTHFKMGSKDGLRKNFNWALQQVVVYFKIMAASFTGRFDIVHVNMGLEKFSIIRDSLACFIWKKLFRKKIILHVHGGYYLMHLPDSKWLKFLLDKSFNHSDKIIVLSEIEKQKLSERYPVLSFEVFPNAVRTEISSEGEHIYYKEKLKIVFLGRINKSKGIHTITKSLAYLKDHFDKFSFEIYGTGPEQQKWTSDLSQMKGLDFNYSGVVSGAEKWNALKLADVFLLPSLHSEGMPIAMLEAMAAGCIVMVSDVASVRTVIHDGQNGFLLEVDEPLQISEKIIEIITGKHNLNRIGNNARRYIQNNYSFHNYVERLDKLYASL